MNDSVINIQNLYKSFGTSQVLKDINFYVRSGEMVSVIGRSGCGKTTMLRCINCTEMPDKGIITIKGESIALTGNESKKEREQIWRVNAENVRLKTGIVFQQLNLFPHLNVLENISLAPRIVKKYSKTDASDIAMEQIKKVGLEGFEKRSPDSLSGGQAQRVAIARALAMSPEVMLYDEPTSALDPELISEVLNVMRKLHDDGMTQIIVTHALNFAKSASDAIFYMEEGEIIEKSPPDMIFNNPKDERTAKYIKTIIDL